MATLNRRKFIKYALAGTVAVSTPIAIKHFFKRDPGRLVILHTNDMHSQIDPFPSNHARFPGMGGFARRAALVNKIRNENPHVLLFDSGDIFQGTPYFNFYNGRLELQLMSKLKYDAATLGNHEFDNGMNSLALQLDYATFPFVTTNYNLQGTPIEGKTVPWMVIEKGGYKIGVVGLGINPRGLVSPVNFEGLTYLDPVETGDETAKMLKENRNCDLVIALSHLGFQMGEGRVDDLTLAASSSYIDMILGGHSHRFMEVPELVTNLAGKQVIVLQSGFGGVRMSRIDLIAGKANSHATSKHYNITG